MKRATLFRNGRLLTMDEGPVLREADLWIADGKIVRIADRDIRKNSGKADRRTWHRDGETGLAVSDTAAVGGAEDAEEIDCSGCVIMPGLIDSHVHYDESYMGDFFIASGITSVRNLRGIEEHAGWRDEILAGKRVGPYIYSSGPVVDGDDDTIPDNDNLIVHTEEDVEAAIADIKRLGFLWMKTYPSIEPELYRYLLRRCREEGLPVCGHMTKRMDHRELADAGYVSCEHTSSLPADPEVIRYLAERGMWFCPTHVVCETLPDYVWNGKQLEELPHFKDLPQCVREKWKGQNEVIIANYRKLNVHPDFQTIIDRGLEFMKYSDRIMAGTDCPYPGIVPGFALAEELEKLVSVYGMTIYDALQAATSRPAEHMNILHQKGKLMEGMDSDLIVLEQNPLENVGNVRSIRSVHQGRRSWNRAELQKILDAVRNLRQEEIEFMPLS